MNYRELFTLLEFLVRGKFYGFVLLSLENEEIAKENGKEDRSLNRVHLGFIKIKENKNKKMTLVSYTTYSFNTYIYKLYYSNTCH